MNVKFVRRPAETDLCAACHAFTLHVRALGKLKRLYVLVDQNFYLFLPFETILGKNCFC